MTSRSGQESGFTRRDFLKSLGTALVGVMVDPQVIQGKENRETRRSIMKFFKYPSTDGKRPVYVAYKFPVGQSWTETYVDEILKRLGPNAEVVKSSPLGENVQIYIVSIDVKNTRTSPATYEEDNRQNRRNSTIGGTTRSATDRIIGDVASEVSRSSQTLGTIVGGLGQIAAGETESRQRQREISQGLEEAQNGRRLVTITVGDKKIRVDCKFKFNTEEIIKGLEMQEVEEQTNNSDKRKPEIFTVREPIKLAGQGEEDGVLDQALIKRVILTFSKNNILPY